MFAFVFESVGSGEWLVLLAVVLIVVGPKNLPSAARKMGEIMSKLRRAADEFKRQLMTMDEEMKKTADEIKRDYIDIPEDGSGTTSTDSAEIGASYGDPDYDPSVGTEETGGYSERYPGEEYADETSGDVASSDAVESHEAAPEVAASAAPAAETPASGAHDMESLSATSATPEKMNG